MYDHYNLDQVRTFTENRTGSILDVRPSAAFIGWRLAGEARGGHIPGAVCLPPAWLDALPEQDRLPYLEERGLHPDTEILVYGYGEDDARAMADRLVSNGFKNLAVFPGGFTEWAETEDLPVERLPRFQQLVHPDWLRALLAGEAPETYPGRGFVLLHINFGVPEEYAYQHLPGAVYLDTNRLEAPDTWNRRSPEEIEAVLTSLGIRHDTTVILYGRDSVPELDEPWPGRHAGQIAAARAAAVLTYAGVEDVRLLDGGFDGWVAAGLPVESEPNSPNPVEDFGVNIPAAPEVFVDLPDARRIIQDPDGRLVSIRTWTEFTGQVSGYRYIGPQGRIPGAVWGNCGANAYHMQHYRSPANTMRPSIEIAENWAEADIRPENRVAFYCGTGWRASETWFYARVMGWDRVSIYDGGWYEWSGDPDNPVESGVPEDTDAPAPDENRRFERDSIPEYSGDRSVD